MSIRDMTHKERLIAILAGQSPDRIPWVPRLKPWYEAHRRQGTLPDRYVGSSLREIERDLGMGTPARDGRVFRTELRDVEIRVQELGSETRTEYVTPLGTVSTLHRCTSEVRRKGIKGLQVEHMIKTRADYPVVEYLIEHMEVIPTYEEYLVYAEEIGEDGVPLVRIGRDPMTRFLLELVGLEQAYSTHLHDYRDAADRLLAVLKDHAKEIQQVAIESPARLIMHGYHCDSQMTSPYFFREHMVPYFRDFAESLHKHSKLLVCHADADTSLQLENIKRAGFDMVECFATAPMVPVTLEQARIAFGTEVIIWGGIPSIMLCDPFSDQEFDEYMHHLFRVIAPGDAFILGVSDNVMPEAKLERLERVSEMVNEYGQCPLSIGLP